jgi:hypothetical protein
MKTTRFHISKVLDKDGVIAHRAIFSRFKELHAVEVRDVHSALVRRWAVRIILIDIHTEEQNVNSVNGLE